MRRLRFLPLGLLILLSCSKGDVLPSGEEGTGEVTIVLSSDGSSDDVSPALKSEETYIPDTDDFEVEIYNSKGIRLYRDTYANSAGRKIPLNSGEYRLLAQYGDSSGVGFDAVWFSADRQFVVRPQTVESVDATARMNKVKVAVSHGPNIQATYADYYSVIRQDGRQEELKFVKDETRAGYIPAGQLEYVLYVKNGATGKWLYYQIPAKEYGPNSFVTFNVDFNTGEGAFKVSVSVSDDVEKVDCEYDIPLEATAQDAPSVALSGFDGSNAFSFYEGAEYRNVQANIVAKGGIRDCILTVESDYLRKAGVPESVNLADPDMDADVEAALKASGFRWVRDMRGNRFANVDFAHLSESISSTAGTDLFSGEFSITVIDSADKTSDTDGGPVRFSISQKQAGFTFNTPEQYNAYARRITGVTASLEAGTPEPLVLQYRKSGGDGAWDEVGYASVSEDGTVTFNDIKGLEPETEYQLRAIYNHNENIASEIVSLTTEPDTQPENAGFEDWKEWTYYVNKSGLFWGDDVYQTNYAPYENDSSIWWDCNNTETTPGDRTNTGASYKSFPMVSYVPGREGGRAAQMMTIAISNTATSVTCPSPTVRSGKIFSGVYGGEQSRPFLSRPDRMKFWYRYTSCDSDSFRAYVSLRNGDTVIGEAEFTSSETVSSWKGADVEIHYGRTDLKADAIYIEFVCGSGSDKWQYGLDVTYGGDKTANVHGGSILIIDDLELIYE